MSNFPHEALEPMDATPRIQPETAGYVIRLVDELRQLKPEASFGTTPAIVIAVWQGALVKYLVDEQQCEETINNLERAISELKVKS